MGLLEFANWLQSTQLSLAIQSSVWIVPALQSVHIITIGVVFVAVLMVALRVLGLARADEPLVRVWGRFAPFLWWGVAILAVSGALLTVSEPVREFMTFSYRAKMLLLVLCVASAAAFGRSVRNAAGTPGQAGGALRFGAAATVLLWLAIIFLGRAIAYDDLIWGDWSPAVLQRGAAS